MKINYKCHNGLFEIIFIPEKSDTVSINTFRNSYKVTVKVEMALKRCKIHLPSDWTLNSVHPDILALATLSIIYPFCGPKIVLPIGVSRHFHELFAKLTNKQLLPVNDQLTLRKAPNDAVPALAYSGGVDSTVAALLLPSETHLFYFDRIIPTGYTKTLLNQEAAYYACNSLTKLGRKVHKIKSDLQYVRKPVGFASFLADAVPALLLADYYGFDSLANGHTLEEGYQIGYGGYKDCNDTILGTLWKNLLDAADMPFTLPTIGLSEVCTTSILLESPYKEFAQACSRGKIKRPCMNCYKCFRKSLLEKVISGSSISDSYLNKLFQIKDAQRVITTSYLHFGNVITYITAKYKGRHVKMNLLKKKTRGHLLNVDWMNKWYSPSQEMLAPKYRNYVKKEILKHVKEMNMNDIKNMKTSFSKKNLS